MNLRFKPANFIHRRNRLLSTALLAGLLTGCGTMASAPAPVAPQVHTLTLLSVNDFHGNLQSHDPTPLTLRLPDATGALQKPEPAGGIPYLASALTELRAAHPDAVVIAAGDLIGASPQTSALLADEPSLEAFDKLGIVASALGNHELDGGLAVLQDKISGKCPQTGCPLPGYTGIHFPYLAANLVDANTGKQIFKGYVIKEIDGLKVAFVGVVTKSTPSISLPRNMVGLRFLDETDTLNALVPKLRAEGAQVLIAVMHEGAEYRGAANDPSYACTGITGRGLEIAQQLSKDYAMIISGHSHMAYTCKVDGRLLVQAGSFGAWITQTTLKVDAQGQVLDAQAVNVPVLQSHYKPAPEFAALEERAEALTAPVRLKPIAVLAHGLTRFPKDPLGDGALGNLIADGMAAFGRAHDEAHVSPVIGLMNQGGIRTDLNASPARAVTLSELTAIQPFHNDLVALTISGAQLRELLARQLPRGPGQPRMLQVSSNLNYTWKRAADGSSTLLDVKVDGQPLDDAHDYRLIVNGFMADGGEGLTVLKQGRDRTSLGEDLDALIEYVAKHPEAVDQVEPGRIRRLEP